MAYHATRGRLLCFPSKIEQEICERRGLDMFRRSGRVLFRQNWEGCRDVWRTDERGRDSQELRLPYQGCNQARIDGLHDPEPLEVCLNPVVVP